MHLDLESVISCLATLLHISPTRYIWSFDTSPDLPHTLISELRTNPAFHELLETRYPSPLDSEADGHNAHGNGSNKSKGRRKPDTNPLDWLGDYLLSVADTEKGLVTQVGEEKGSGMAFAEALAVATNMVFQELQHGRLSNELRATAASAGFEVRDVHCSINATLITCITGNPSSLSDTDCRRRVREYRHLLHTRPSLLVYHNRRFPLEEPSPSCMV